MADAVLTSADRVALEEERDFCLRSLRDLEAEFAAGDLGEADYQALKDTYVARAAAALKELDGSSEGSAAAPEASGGIPSGQPPAGTVPGRRRWRRFAVAGLAVAAVAGIASWAMVAASGSRLPGQTITGQPLAPTVVAQNLQQAQQASDRGDALSALKDYEKILKSDPNQPQALTGAGWILAQTQQPSLLQQGVSMLSSAEQADPTYAPAHLYRGIALYSEGDYAGSVPELQWYLAHDPDPSLIAKVQQTLQQAEAKAKAAGKS